MSQKKVAFLVAAEGIEQVELTHPWQAVEDAGALPVLLAPSSGTVQAFHHLDRGGEFTVDLEVGSADVDEYVALVLPGGVANPDSLRTDEAAVAFVSDFLASGKPVAAICHAPWTLIEAHGVRARTVTSWPSLRTDLTNAGATWVDQELVVDDNGAGSLLTSRGPDDLPAFSQALVARL